MRIDFTVNGAAFSLDVDPRETLLHVLRERLGLRGTKYGCGEGECGACTVILNDRTVNACLVPVGQAHGAQILTIEGMLEDPIGRPLIETFAEHGAVQCGFCTPGFVISARALLAANPRPSIKETQEALAGNLCRCTGYTKIIEAVAVAADRVGDQELVQPGSPPQARELELDGFARPNSLDQALSLLAQDQDWRILGGSTDLGVAFEYQLKDHRWLDLSALELLTLIREEKDALIIGGRVTFSSLIQSPAVQRWAQVLVQAAKAVGGRQIQNMGTLAGNLINASPAADAVPALQVLDAVAVLRSVRGERRVPVCDLATGPGQTVIAADEILTQVVIPLRARTGKELGFFEKLGPRQVQAIAIASVAFRGWFEPASGRLTGVRVALGAVAPTVMLAPSTAGILMGGPLTGERILEAGEMAAQECRPIDDLRGSAVYRRRLVHGLLVRGLWSYRVSGPAAGS